MRIGESRQSSGRRKAENYFRLEEGRDAALRNEIGKDRNRSAAKTARLRALRLAREAANKERLGDEVFAPGR